MQRNIIITWLLAALLNIGLDASFSSYGGPGKSQADVTVLSDTMQRGGPRTSVVFFPKTQKPSLIM